MQTHNHIDPAVAKVLGMGMALTAIANDGDRFADERIEFGVLVVIKRCWHENSLFAWFGLPT